MRAVAVVLLVFGLSSQAVPVAAQEIPFDLVQGYLVVAKARVQKHQVRVVLDTASSTTIVSQRLARRFRSTGWEKLTAINQRIEVERVVLPDFELGPVRIESLPVLSSDLSFIEDLLGLRVDVLLGLDVLSRQNLTIDFRDKRLLMGVKLPEDHFVPFYRHGDLLTVFLDLPGQALRLVLDTGSANLILYDQHGNLKKHCKFLKQTSLTGLAGEIRAAEVTFPPSALGRVRLPSQAAVLVEAAPPGAADFDGLLGIAALSATAVSLDFERNLLLWQKRK